MEGGDLLARFRAHVTREGLFGPPGTVLVAVSGGADSLALLHLMQAVSADHGLALAVGHVDHGIHPESGNWASRVESIADHLGVPFCAVCLGLGPGASETLAREERYDALRQLQKDLDAKYLATAHHADDQIETALQRLLRGSGPAGLAGIPALGPRGLIRPVLPFRKVELTGWLESTTDVLPCVDPANLDLAHDRSWLRSALLPLIRERFPDVDDRLLELVGQARADRDAWGAVLRALPGLEFRAESELVEVARESVQRYDKVLSVAVLRAAAREVGCRVGRRRAEQLVAFLESAESGRVVELGDGWVAEVVFDRLRISQLQGGSQHRSAEESGWGGEAVGEATWGSWCLRWQTEPAGHPGRSGFTTWVTPGSGMVRGLREGDRIRPYRGRGQRKVRRVLMEARVPRADRMRYPVVVRDDDVLWIPGICRSSRALPQPGEPALRLDASQR